MNFMIPSDRSSDGGVPSVPDTWGGALSAPGGYPAGAGSSHESMHSRGRLVLLWLLDLVLKHKLLIATACVLALAAGFVKTKLAVPLYEASTTIRIDEQAPRVLSKNSGGGEDYAREPFFFQTQYELLKSRSLAQRVARNLDAADAAALLKPEAPSLPSRLLRTLTGRAPTPVSDRLITADMIEADQARAAGMIAGGITIQPVPLSRIVRIGFTHSDPAVAQKISTAVAESFVASQLDRRVDASGYARAFFEERLQQLKQKLEDSEKQVVAYARREGIANVDDKQPELTSRLSSINAALATATAERIRQEGLWNQAKAGNDLSLPQVMSDPAVQAAREKRAQLATDYQDKLNLLKPAFPEMVQLRSQINEQDRQIRTRVDLVKESIRSQFEAARAQEQSLGKTLADLRDQALDLRTRSIQYNILLRELDTNKALYDGLLQQYKEVGVASALGTNNVSIVDRAELPGAPVSPSLTRNLLLMLVVGLGIAAAVIYVLELLDDTFKSIENVEETLGLTALGVIPLAVQDLSKQIETVIDDKRSAVSEAYRSLRTALQFSTETGVPKVLLVTSAKPSEGKSTTATSLAMNFAQLGMRVLLIDADLRSPSLGRLLRIDNTIGLSNYLASGADIDSVTQSCSVENVSLIPAGPMPPNPAELLAGPRLSVLLAQASETYDVVLIDGPPVMGLADAPILSSVVAGTLLVIQSNATHRGVVRAAVKRLRFARARIVGTALTKFDVRASGYTYSYSYNYEYSYPNRSADDVDKPKLARPGRSA